VNTHNTDRAKHGVAGLKWDNDAAKYAQNWANNCDFKHSGGKYGENLFGVWATGAFDYINQTKADITDGWYAEIAKYDFNNPGFSEETGHFTQVVWKSSKKLGCAWNQNPCISNNVPFYKFVCEYDPPGNVIGDNGSYFRDNVPRP
ncbi:PR-1-like protein, partial [Lophiostoma macrostomum CBS 122681]